MPMAKNKRFEIRIVTLEDRWQVSVAKNSIENFKKILLRKNECFLQIFINNKYWVDRPFLMPLNRISHVSVFARFGYSDVQLNYVHVGQKYNVRFSRHSLDFSFSLSSEMQEQKKH